MHPKRQLNTHKPITEAFCGGHMIYHAYDIPRICNVPQLCNTQRIHAPKKSPSVRAQFPLRKNPLPSESEICGRNTVNRYNQLLVIWKYIPVPTTGRFPDSYINTHDRLPNSNESVTVPDINHALLTYSDEIAQDFHLFPYYPQSARDRQRHQLFLTRYALSYH